MKAYSQEWYARHVEILECCKQYPDELLPIVEILLEYKPWLIIEYEDAVNEAGNLINCAIALLKLQAA